MARQMPLTQKQKYEAYDHRSKEILIDFDGTLATWAYPALGEPTPGAKEAVEELRKEGYKVIVWTSRMDPSIYTQFEIGQAHSKIRQWLYENCIEVDGIDWGDKGKRLALAYIDDRGVSFNGNWELALERVAFIRYKTEVEKLGRDAGESNSPVDPGD